MTTQIKRTINLPPIDELMIDKFIPFIDCKDRYINFIGGRGSGKSVAVCQIIIIRLITHKFFRGICFRKYAKDVVGSIYKTLKDIIIDWNLEELFSWKESPFTITCKRTKNYVIFAGQDDPSSIKSLREPTFAFFEEECSDSLEHFNTIDLSFRSYKADFIQTIHALNPTLEGNPTDHWFYKFMKYDVYNCMDFRDTTEGIINGKHTEYSIRSMHTTYKNNPFLPDQYRLKLESETDSYSYAVNTLGIWCQKQIDDNFYKSFDKEKNVDFFEYDRSKKLFLGIDFNLYPYSAITLFQMDGKRLYQIDEICVNDTKLPSIIASIREFKRRYKGHYLEIYITGDSTGKSEDASHEKGYNKFSEFRNELEPEFKLNIYIPTSNPKVEARGGFLNEVFLKSDKAGGVELFLNKSCPNTISDFMYTKAAEDGTIRKEYVLNKETKKKYEKYGHLSDSVGYLVCAIFHDSFSLYQNPPIDFSFLGIKRQTKHGY